MTAYETNDDYRVLHRRFWLPDLKKADNSMTVGGKKVYLDDATQYLKVEASAATSTSRPLPAAPTLPSPA